MREVSYHHFRIIIKQTHHAFHLLENNNVEPHKDLKDVC